MGHMASTLNYKKHKNFSGKIIRKISVEKNFISFIRDSFNKTASFFTVAPCIFMLSKFYLPTNAQKSCFKRILKFTLKQFLHVSVQSQSSGSVLFELAKVIVIKIIS